MAGDVAFEVQAVEDGEGTRFEVIPSDGTATRHYHLPGGEQHDYTVFYQELGRDFGTRVPHLYVEPPPHPPGMPEWTPLITENLSPRILAG